MIIRHLRLVLGKIKVTKRNRKTASLHFILIYAGSDRDQDPPAINLPDVLTVLKECLANSPHILATPLKIWQQTLETVQWSV